MPIIIKTLNKTYGNKQVLNDINLEINDGDIFGILGPNGSGKSTLLRILAGISQYDYGYVNVEGIDAKSNPIELRKIVGYVPETPYLYESLTPLEYFEFIGSIRGIKEDVLNRRSRDLIKAFGMEEYSDQFIGSLSFGTKQKVSIIAALLHSPKVLILDESMNGLDPQSAKIFRDLLKELSKDGTIVIFSTHILEIASNVCEKIAIMKEGKIIAEGVTSSLISEKNLEDLFIQLTSTEDIQAVVNALRGSLKDSTV